LSETRYRTVVLVEVNGLAADCVLFEAACQELGWVVLESPVHPAGPQMNRVHYIVEARTPGATNGAQRASLDALNRAATRSNLDVTMLAAQPIRHDFEARTTWRAHVAPPHTAPRGVPSRVWPLLQSWLVWLGWFDLERGVTAATKEEALRLVRRELPGVTPLPPGVRVRPIERDRRPAYANAHMVWRLLATTLLMILAGYLLGTGIDFSVGDGYSLILGFMCLGCGVLLYALLIRDSIGPTVEEPTGRGRHALGLAVSLALLTSWGISKGLSSRPDPELMLVVAVLIIPRGLYLFISRSTWRTWLPWLLPALLPFVFTLLPGIGSTVSLVYLYAFGAEPADVEVASYWQLYAAMRWSVVALALLMGPALYGYLRHANTPTVLRRGLGTILIIGVTCVAAVTGAYYLGVAPLRASEDAYRAAIDGRTPATYYGISPEWVCVHPLEGMASGEVPVQGGDFTPGRAYLKLGDSDGTVVLWWRGATVRQSKKFSLDDDETLKLPLSKVRVTPADDPSRRCPP
jgi:hypothetical protein